MEINLTRGKKAIIDDEDYSKIKDYCWCYSGKTNYTQSYGRLIKGKIVPPVGNSRIAKLRRPKKGKFFLPNTKFYKPENKGVSISMHKLIMKPEKGMIVDHINGDGLDNRKSNLRICTQIQNSHNHKKSIKNTSGYTGVCLCRTENRKKRWMAAIRNCGKKIYIGRFFTKEEAAFAYNDSAKKLHGEFAYLNEVLTEPKK